MLIQPIKAILKKVGIYTHTGFLKFWWGFVYLLVLMNFWRLIFLLAQFGTLEISSGSIYITSFLVGIRLDAVVASYLSLPLVGVSVLKYRRSVFQYVSKAYLFVVTLGISLINIVDIFFFREFNSHLSFLMLKSYVGQKESMEFVFEEYPITMAVGFLLVISWLAFMLYRKLDNSIKERQTSILLRAFWLVLSVTMLGTSIRGGWQERPIDWGHAMFSKDFVANEIALNSLFFLGRSIVQFNSESKTSGMINYYDSREALDVTRAILNSPEAQFTHESSITRINKDHSEKSYNVVLVILESHAGVFCGYINGKEHSVTPILDSLANQGLAFTNCFANGKRSAHGVGSIIMSWPNLPGLPLISRVESVNNVPSLGTSLQDIGYKTIFLYGGDPQFDNMKGFMTANGFDQVIENHDFSRQAKGTKWGVFDHYVFNRALDEIDKAKRPLLLTMFTTTNHQPWQVPDDYEDLIPSFPDQTYRGGAVHRTMAYVDHVLGEFMEAAAQKEWFTNTIFVFIADHGLSIVRGQHENIRNASIPFVIYAPGLSLPHQTISHPVSQVDVAPTILGLLGYSQPYTFFGQDVLSTDSTVACRIAGDRAYWVEDDYLYTEIFGQSSALYNVSFPIDSSAKIMSSNSAPFDYYQRRFRSYIQTGYSLFQTFGKNNNK